MLEQIWQERVKRGEPCVQGMCGRESCTTCETQQVLWEIWNKTMEG